MANENALFLYPAGLKREARFRSACSQVASVKKSVVVSDKTEKNIKSLTLKQRFLQAVISGELGSIDSRGYIVTLKEFKFYFSDITSQYRDSFLPAATLEAGQSTMTHTKFVFRLSKGVYLLHSDLLA